MVLEKGKANTDKREDKRKEEEEEEEEEEEKKRKEEEEEEEEKRKEERRKGKRISQVWNSGMDTWFRTLYLMYGLGLGTPKLISCRVELRRVLRILDACFRKGLVAS